MSSSSQSTSAMQIENKPEYPKVKLVSNDAKEFIVEKRVMKLSSFIEQILEGMCFLFLFDLFFLNFYLMFVACS